MKVRANTCVACHDDRVELSMTRIEAEILLSEMNTYACGTMLRRAVEKLRSVVSVAPAKPKTKKAEEKS